MNEDSVKYSTTVNCSVGFNCPICGDFIEGISSKLWCDKCGEALKELIREKRNISYVPLEK